MKFKYKIRALSLFSNVGVAETYFKDIGVEVLLANEILADRCRFYSHLYPEVEMINGDITDRKIFDLIVKRSKELNINFIIATPPCQGMSCAGRKDPKDKRNYLIYYAVEAVKEINPKFVLFENVPMQQHTKIMHRNKLTYIPDYIEEELGDNYTFNQNRIINSMDYGIPQSRTRYIYLMSRKSENVAWEFPAKENKIITLKEAIGDLPSLDPKLRDKDTVSCFPDFENKVKSAEKISKWHVPPVHSWKQVEWMIHTPTGCSAFLNKKYFPRKDNRKIKGAPRTYMRLSWDKPSTTIMQNSGVISSFSSVHPGRVIVDSLDDSVRQYSDPRVLSIYELLIVSSLPKDWNIPIWANDILIRKVIGEGIPPLLIKKILLSLISLGKYDW